MILLFFSVSKSLNLGLLILLLISCGAIIIYGLIYIPNRPEFLDALIIAIYLFIQNLLFITLFYSEIDDIPLHEVLLFFHFIVFATKGNLCYSDNFKIWGGCCK